MVNRFIIYEYMSRIKKEDIVRFGISQGVKLEEYEVEHKKRNSKSKAILYRTVFKRGIKKWIEKKELMIF